MQITSRLFNSLRIAQSEFRADRDVRTTQNTEREETTARGLPWRRMGRIVLIDALILCALFAVGEIVLRCCVPDSGKFVYTPDVTGGYSVRLNSIGLREREFPQQRPADETRVLCLGNSTTFGTGVAAADTYAKRLQSRLNEEREEQVFVINAGGQANTPRIVAEFLRGLGVSYEPAVVILGFSPSMISHTIMDQEAVAMKTAPDRVSPRGPRVAVHRGRSLAMLQPANVATLLGTAKRCLSRGLHQSRFYTFTKAQCRGLLFRMGVHRASLREPLSCFPAYAFRDECDLREISAAYERFDAQLSEIKSLLDEAGIPLVVVGIPSRFELSNAAVDNQFHVPTGDIQIAPLERVAAMCERRGITFVNLLPRLRSARQEMLAGRRKWNPLYIDLDPTHLNAAGHRIAAEEIAIRVDVPRWSLRDAK